MAINCRIIQVEFKGLRPLMFDRYAGDNNTKLPVADKMYLSPDRHLIMPALNIFSLLSAENTPSVCRQFLGRQGKTIGLGIKSYTTIQPDDIAIEDDNGPILFSGFNEQIEVRHHVARLKAGIPNPKERPRLNLPWWIRFQVIYIPNTLCTESNLRQAYEYGGILGLGTFRPFFGRYEVSRWDAKDGTY